MKSEGKITIELYSVDGQKLINKNMNYHTGMNKYSINVSNLPKGIYLLNIYDEKKMLESIKVIK